MYWCKTFVNDCLSSNWAIDQAHQLLILLYSYTVLCAPQVFIKKEMRGEESKNVTASDRHRLLVSEWKILGEAEESGRDRRSWVACIKLAILFALSCVSHPFTSRPFLSCNYMWSKLSVKDEMKRLEQYSFIRPFSKMFALLGLPTSSFVISLPKWLLHQIMQPYLFGVLSKSFALRLNLIWLSDILH